jgi:RNA polymerase sigma factor (sigma-70 family)
MSATARRLLRPNEKERSRRFHHGVPAGDSRTSSRPGSDVDRLVARYLPLAEKLAHRYRHTAEPLDDLVQVARLGLLKAARRWDPDRGLAFSSFAVPTILGELRRYFRDSTWAIRPPRDLQELALAVRRARDELWQQLGGEPTAQTSPPTWASRWRRSSRRSRRSTAMPPRRSTRPHTTTRRTAPPGTRRSRTLGPASAAAMTGSPSSSSAPCWTSASARCCT